MIKRHWKPKSEVEQKRKKSRIPFKITADTGVTIFSGTLTLPFQVNEDNLIFAVVDVEHEGNLAHISFKKVSS